MVIKYSTRLLLTLTDRCGSGIKHMHNTNTNSFKMRGTKRQPNSYFYAYIASHGDCAIKHRRRNENKEVQCDDDTLARGCRVMTASEFDRLEEAEIMASEAKARSSGENE